MAEECKLRDANGSAGHPCDGDKCVYWRVVGHLGVLEGENGCAVQHFELLDGSSEIATWLLSVKQRVEDIRYDG